VDALAQLPPTAAGVGEVPDAGRPSRLDEVDGRVGVAVAVLGVPLVVREGGLGGD